MKPHIAAIALCLWSSGPAAMAGLRVVDAAGAPVRDAEVVLTLRASVSKLLRLLPSTLSARTDAHGQTDLQLPSAGESLLFVNHPSHAPVAISGRSEALPAVVRLAGGQRWRGRLTLPSAAAAPGFPNGRVCASGQLTVPPPGKAPRWERCGEVDPEGWFDLRGLPRGTFTVRAQVDGFLPLDRLIDPALAPELVLEQGSLLEGVVTDLRGRPLRGVSVQVRDGGASTTSGDGRFAVAAATLPATIELEAARFRRQIVEVSRQHEIAVQLHPATQFVGTLRGDDPSDLQNVTVRTGETVDGMRHTRTRKLIVDEGRFALEVPDRSGIRDLILSVPHYRDLNLGSVPITSGETVDLGALRLERGAGVSGQVLDSISGSPAAGASVEVLPLGPALLSALSGSRPHLDVAREDGAFLVAGLEPGRYLVRVQHANRASAHELVNLERPEVFSLGTVMLHTGARLRGHVRGRGGAALAGAEVRLYDRAREFMEPLRTTVSNVDGEYEISGVAPGTYRADIRSGRLLLSQQIDVRPGQEDVEIDFSAGGGRLDGVITRNGAPVRGGAVLVMSVLDPGDRRGKLIVRRNNQEFGYGLPESPLTATVDEHGRFVFDDCPAGVVRLIYHDAAGVRVVRFARINDREENILTLDLTGATLAGRLVDDATGGGIEGRVSLIDASGQAVVDVSTGPGGSFQFNDLIEGNYALVGTSTGYETRRLEGVGVAAESAPVVVGLTTGEGGAVTVSLNRPDATPAVDVPVSLFGPGGRLISALHTLADGRVTFSNLPSGEYLAAWYDPLSGAGVSSTLSPKPYRTAAVTRTLVAGGSLTLNCSLPRCRDAIVDLLEIESEDRLEIGPLLPGVSSALRLSRDGGISLGRVTPGRYVVRLRIGDHHWEESVTVGHSGATAKFE
jgi:hypothetical protein